MILAELSSRSAASALTRCIRRVLYLHVRTHTLLHNQINIFVDLLYCYMCILVKLDIRWKK